MTAFDARRFERLVEERKLGLGAPLTAREVTGSTNDDALEAARGGAAHGATFVAELQTKGRGRRGATWTAPAGESLLFSVVLRPELELREASTLTLAVGLAIRDSIASRIDRRALVKWPNDVYVEGRKIAGILLESQISGTRVSAIVAGVGINVTERVFPPELASIATSLALLGARDLDREALLADALEAIERRTAEHARSLATLLTEIRAHDALRDRRVRVDGVEGRACGIGADGALLIEDAAGVEHAVRAGSVELR